MPKNLYESEHDFFQFKKPVILITGANGYIGRVIADALRENFNSILVDYHTGHDRFNRFGLEQADPPLVAPKTDSIISIDLATQRDRFEKLLDEQSPACVLHFAGILENQEVSVIKTNSAINRNVLEACAARKIPVAFASSIMVMYGAAMADDKVRSAFEGKPVKLFLDERHSVCTELKNTPENIRKFNQDTWEQNFTYIKEKEFAEQLAQSLVAQNPELTMVSVRIGWTGIKNPYVLEVDSKPEYTETPGYLDKMDLKSFMLQLVSAILSSNIHGYKCYPCVSIHPSCWVNQENARRDLQWSPQIDIEKKYRLTARARGPILRSRL